MVDYAGTGGGGGIPTPGRSFSPYNGLANRRLQPLGHLSGVCIQQLTTLLYFIWRTVGAQSTREASGNLKRRHLHHRSAEIPRLDQQTIPRAAIPNCTNHFSVVNTLRESRFDSACSIEGFQLFGGEFHIQTGEIILELRY